MTYTWAYLQENPQDSKRLVGVNYENLVALIELAKKLEKQAKEKEKNGINETRGAKPKLEPEEQIVLTLVYLRQNLTFLVLGLMFQVTESTANNYFHYWLTIFNNALPPSLIEQAKNHEIWSDNLSNFLSKSELIVDSLEQPRPRPIKYQEQKKCFSGKKGYHTIKSQLIVLPRGADIVDISSGKEGPFSDINIWRERKDVFSPEQEFSGDKAYVGEPQINTPHKKPRKRELTTEQKEENRRFSSDRVFVEHVIGKLKTFRVISEKFRLRINKYNTVFEAVCGLVRLNLGTLILEVLNQRVDDETIEVYIDSLWGSFLTKNSSNLDLTLNQSK